MDLSALPNNNHPDKFLQLDVKSLAKTSVFLQTWLANFPEEHFPGEQQWHNRVYSQKEKKNAREEPVVQPSTLHPAMIDKALGKHITPVTLKSTIKSNPLYSDVFTDNSWQERKNNPSWTVQDYDRHSLNSSLADYLKKMCFFKDGNLLTEKVSEWTELLFIALKENPNEIQYWMEDIYTPGYDTLLKKKERERKLSRCCLIMLLLVLLVCIVAATVTVCILLA